MCVDLTDFVDSIDDEIDLALEEGADPIDIADALIFVAGQFLLDYETAENVTADMVSIVTQTGPVLEQLEADTGFLH